MSARALCLNCGAVITWFRASVPDLLCKGCVREAEQEREILQSVDEWVLKQIEDAYIRGEVG